MARYSAMEVYQFVINSSFPSNLAPMIAELRTAGAFSSVMAGLIDKLQADDAFRRSLLREGVTSIIDRYHLPAPEILALVMAATVLAPGAEWPKNQVSATVAPSPYELSQRYRNQTADFGSVRQTEIEPLIKAILQSREDAEQIALNPCLCLGVGNHNRAEFVFLYLLAATTTMKTKWWKLSSQVNISTDFLMASNLSFEEAQDLAESMVQMIRSARSRGG